MTETQWTNNLIIAQQEQLLLGSVNYAVGKDASSDGRIVCSSDDLSLSIKLRSSHPAEKFASISNFLFNFKIYIHFHGYGFIINLTVFLPLKVI